MIPVILVVASFAVAAWMCLVQVRHIRTVRAGRRRLFDACAHLVDDAHVHESGLGYPRLTGSHLGSALRLTPLVDTMTLRKLPVLWLQATWDRRLPVDHPTDVLARPLGTEFFSPNAQYGHELAVHLGLPSHTRIASPVPLDEDERRRSATLLESIQGFLGDPRTKEVLLCPDGVRIVWRLAEADQATYRSTRRPDFRTVGLTSADLAMILGALAALGSTCQPEPFQVPG